MTLLKRKIPAKAWDCAAQTLATKKFATCLLADDQEMACVYIVNTCEEILEKLPQVQDAILRDIEEEYEDKLELEEVSSNTCRALINESIRVLINSILGRTEVIYQNQMVRMNWTQFEEVTDTSEYIRAVSKQL